MNNYELNLSGLGDRILEIKIRKSVENAGYSVQELSDMQKPVQYNLSDSLFNRDILWQTLVHFQKAAILKPDTIVPKNNIDTLLNEFSFDNLSDIILKI
jgi:hypothetical protein